MTVEQIAMLAMQGVVALLTGMCLFFVKELWALWKEQSAATELLRKDLNGHILEDARTYFTKDEFNRDVRPRLHDHSNRIQTLEHTVKT